MWNFLSTCEICSKGKRLGKIQFSFYETFVMLINYFDNCIFLLYFNSSEFFLIVVLFILWGVLFDFQTFFSDMMTSLKRQLTFLIIFSSFICCELAIRDYNYLVFENFALNEQIHKQELLATRQLRNLRNELHNLHTIMPSNFRGLIIFLIKIKIQPINKKT